MTHAGGGGCALRLRSWQASLDCVVRKEGCLDVQLQETLPTENPACMACPDVGQAEWGQQAFQERESYARRHQNKKYFGKDKPLQEVQRRGSVEEGRHEMRLRFMENMGDHERKAGFLF